MTGNGEARGIVESQVETEDGEAHWKRGKVGGKVEKRTRFTWMNERAWWTLWRDAAWSLVASFWSREEEEEGAGSEDGKRKSKCEKTRGGGLTVCCPCVLRVGRGSIILCVQICRFVCCCVVAS